MVCKVILRFVTLQVSSIKERERDKLETIRTEAWQSLIVVSAKIKNTEYDYFMYSAANVSISNL